MALITTSRGLLPEEMLVRSDPVFEDENEITRATEYRLDGEIVHRSVHVQLKRGPDGCEAIMSTLGG